ncbi:MAG: aminotransferase class V-fold PLP-dependent enzyme [Phycisphaerae bacterium]
MTHANDLPANPLSAAPAAGGRAAPRRLYMDNAATSFPKPRQVTEAMMRFATDIGASAGRGAYAEAAEAGRVIAECRRLINLLLHGESEQHVAFTLNATDALNTAIHGLIDPARGGHIICTATDHNSVLRPCQALADAGVVSLSHVPVGSDGLLDPQDVRRAIRRDTRLVAMTHASNVTGAVQDARAVGRICRELAVPFVLDAAQSVGHIPLNVQEDCVDVLCAPGHKSLLGPLGTGFMYLRPGMERRLRPLRQGGTGSQSDEPRHPDIMPDKYEAGSHNLVGLAGLLEGLRWVLAKGVDLLHEHQLALVRTFIGAVGQCPGLRYYGPQGVQNRLGVFSVAVDGLTPPEVSRRLEAEYGILTRCGMHCAPLVHRAIGTFDAGGTARLSFGPFLQPQDVRFAADALAEMAMAQATATTSTTAR